jgi:hypothetical protein
MVYGLHNIFAVSDNITIAPRNTFGACLCWITEIRLVPFFDMRFLHETHAKIMACLAAKLAVNAIWQLGVFAL